MAESAIAIQSGPCHVTAGTTALNSPKEARILASILATGAPRRRTFHACDQCRRRKGKCERVSAQSARCDHCQTFNTECTYLHPGFGKGKRRSRRRTTAIAEFSQAHLQRSRSSTARTTSFAPTTITGDPPIAADAIVECRGQAEASSSSSSAAEQSHTALPYVIASGTHPDGQLQWSPESANLCGVFASSASVHGMRTGAHSPGSGLEQRTQSECSPDLPPVIGLSTSSDTQEHARQVIKRYRKYVEPHTPFLDHDRFQSEPPSDLALYCMAVVSEPGEPFNSDNSTDVATRLIFRFLNETAVVRLSENELRAVLLLQLRTSLLHDQGEGGRFCNELILRASGHFSTSNTPVTNHTSRDLSGVFSLPCCAMITAAWKQLAAESRIDPVLDYGASCASPPVTPSTGLTPFAQAFWSVSHILHKLQCAEERELISAELDLLLWPATLPQSLFHIDQTMSSAESSILHVLHNSVALSFYTVQLGNPIVPVEANQGMLSFLAAIGCSCVKVWKRRGSELVRIWRNLYVGATASAMMHMASLSKNFDCPLSRGVLVSFLLTLQAADIQIFTRAFLERLTESLGAPPMSNLYALQSHLAEGLCGSPFEQSDHEGRTVYWMFRDVRSMTLRGLAPT